MSEMIERVAKAVREYVAEVEVKSRGEIDVDVDGMVHSQMIARAAIEAMRDPTEEMKRAGLEEFPSSLAVKETAAEVWYAMIDAALAEPTEKSK
jgi:hypothetical protein